MFLLFDDLIGPRVRRPRRRAKLMAGARVARFHVTRTPSASPSPSSSSRRRNNAAFFSLSPFALCPPLPPLEIGTDRRITRLKVLGKESWCANYPSPLPATTFIKLARPVHRAGGKRGSNSFFWNVTTRSLNSVWNHRFNLVPRLDSANISRVQHGSSLIPRRPFFRGSFESLCTGSFN